MSRISPAWTKVKLGELLPISYGKGLPDSERSDSYAFPVVGSSGINGRTHTPLVEVPCIVIGRKGNIGGANLYEGGCWPIDTTYYCRVPAGVNARFLELQLQAINWTGFDSSTAIPSLRRQDLHDVEVSVPPLEDQQEIVDILEDRLSRIDAAVKSIRYASSRASGLVSLALDLATRGLWEPGARLRPRSSCLENIKPSKFDYSALEDLPEGWEWRSASQVCEAIVCGSTPKSDLMAQGHGDVPFLKVYNISQKGNIDFTIRPTFVSDDTHRGKLARSRVYPGDVLTNIVGPPLGKTAIVPDLYLEWNINQAIVAFRAGAEVHPNWLAIVLRSPFIIEKLKGTARATAGQFNISLTACRELPIPVPPYKRQIEMVEQVARLDQIAEAGAKSMQTALSGARNLREAVLASAFEGGL